MTETEAKPVPVTVDGCTIWNPNPLEGHLSGSGVQIGPGGSITVTSNREDAGVFIRKGAWIRAVDGGGGFVIEAMPVDDPLPVEHPE